MLDKNSFSVSLFKGLLLSDVDSAFPAYTQGEVPFDYALDSENLLYLKKGGMKTRNGVDKYVVESITNTNEKVVGFWQISVLKMVPQTDRWLVLTWDGTNGRFYDTQVAAPATNPVLTLAGMKYAFCINAFGRMYISPWEGWATPLGDAAKGGADTYVWVYNGDYNARWAAGAIPAFGAMAATPVAGGTSTPGLHTIGVLFEYDTGFISAWPTSPTAGLPVTFTAANAKANLTNVPLGGTGVIKRHIILTKVIVNNNGLGLFGYEPFFALLIPDNTTTTGVLDVPDSGLVDSAKIYDPRTRNAIIRSYVSLAVYGSRMVYLGSRNSGAIDGLHNSVAISPAGDPEGINLAGLPTEGKHVVYVGNEYSGKVMCGAELRGTFYVFKEDSTHAFSEDTENNSGSWPVDLIDSGRGAWPFGIAGISDNPGGLVYDNLLVAGNHGISVFNGSFQPVSLTSWIWDQYTIDQLKWVVLVVDPVRKVVFAKLSEPFAAAEAFILMGNYYFGLDIENIRWGKFVYPVVDLGGGAQQILFPHIALRAPGTDGDVGPTNIFDAVYPLLVTAFTFNSGGPKIVLLSDSLNQTDGGSIIDPGGGAPIPWLWESGFTPNVQGEQYTFSNLVIRAMGTPSILVQYAGLDESALATGETLVVGALPAKYLHTNLGGKVAEQLRIKLSGTGRSFIQEIHLFAAERAKARPRA